MLREITISNFKSIGHEITFTMEADSDRVHELPHHVINKNGIDLLRVASMYGPNGGGKSNILQALSLLSMVVNHTELNTSVKYSCVYLNDDEMTLEAFFVTNNFEIGYKVSFHQVKYQKSVNIVLGLPSIADFSSFDIDAEEITFRRKNENEFNLLLTRSNKGTITSEILDKNKIPTNVNLANGVSSLAYYYSTFVNSVSADLIEPLKVISELIHDITNIRNLSLKPTIEMIEKVLLEQKEALIMLLNNCDIPVSDIFIDQQKKIFFVRKVIRNVNEYENKSIPFQLESSGTVKTFYMFVNILIGKSKPIIYLADDLNAYLHPKLFRKVIESFNLNKNSESQLIFNSHDILNMTNEVFRRDEIWFIYRNNDNQTELVTLSNIVNYKGKQIRNDAKYYKQYLEGKFGADPFFKNALNWEK